MIVQINSLWRVRGTYDIVSLDECTYATDMIFHFVEERARGVFISLIYFMKTCEYLLMMDAFLGKAHKEFVVSAMREKAMDFDALITVKVVEYLGNRLSRHIRFCAPDAFEHKILTLIMVHRDRNIFYVSNHKAWLERTQSLYAITRPTERTLLVTADTRLCSSRQI